MGYKTVFEDCDILVIGGGMGGCGAAYETCYWGRDMKIVIAEKANIDRSGAVAQGLYAINCYMGMQWNENQPEDHVRYARNDLMSMVREDLAHDMARHVDSAVHKFEEWGLPIMRDPETGHYQREGKWQSWVTRQARWDDLFFRGPHTPSRHSQCSTPSRTDSISAA